MRNYNTKPKEKKNNKVDLLQCPCCNKKYKSDARRQQHVEKDHYFETRNTNHFKFDHNIKAQIYNSAASYIMKLYEIKKDPYYEEALAKNLLPQLYHKEIPEDELNRISITQQSFAKNLLEENLYQCDWITIMDDLERFFNMGLPYYDTNFNPTLTIDFLWHAMMQCSDLYIDICKKSLGTIMTHCSKIRTANEDLKRYEYFMDVFKNKFGRSPCPFPAQNINTYSSFDIREIFLALANKELEKAEIVRLLKEKQDECYRLQLEQQEEKRRLEKIEFDLLNAEISENVGVDISKCGYLLEGYYHQGYRLGYRGNSLKNYAKDRENYELSKPSTC